MPKDIYALLAAQVRSRRKEAGLSMEKLAELAGIGAGFLAHIETCQKKPSLETVGRIANALQVPVTSLFGGHPGPRPDADLRMALQVTQILRKKTPDQKAALLKAIRTLAKTL